MLDKGGPQTIPSPKQMSYVLQKLGISNSPICSMPFCSEILEVHVHVFQMAHGLSHSYGKFPHLHNDCPSFQRGKTNSSAKHYQSFLVEIMTGEKPPHLQWFGGSFWLFFELSHLHSFVLVFLCSSTQEEEVHFHQPDRITESTPLISSCIQSTIPKQLYKMYQLANANEQPKKCDLSTSEGSPFPLWRIKSFLAQCVFVHIAFQMVLKFPTIRR